MISSIDFNEVVREFAGEIGSEPSYYIKSRPDGDYLVFEFAEPNSRLFEALNRVLASLDFSEPERVTISRRGKKPHSVVSMPEARLLQRELSESLTVDRNTFGDDFLARYTPSVTNHEQSIVGNANYIVYGRRGSGKSSLLAYAMHRIKKRSSSPFAWIALQAYSGRKDAHAIASIVGDILHELSGFAADPQKFSTLAEIFDDLGESNSKTVDAKLDRLLLKARRLLASISSREAPVNIFLDDIHVLNEKIQPRLLSAIYSMTRGNNCFIKASGIEQFTNIWDSSTRLGLEPPHDAQILKLDYNLTMPDRSKAHIVSILDAHAKFCGLPNAAYVAEGEMLSRLVLVAAAVPRDALSLFSQAITKSVVKGQRAVTIMSVNAAASETIEEKLRDIGKDIAGGEIDDVQAMLDALKDFCIKTHGKNAFLVRIDSRSSDYRVIQKLIALRFVHVLHEGITPHKVGERYVALMLDFGFYIGIRAAKSVRLFPDKPRQLTAKELRMLPIFSSSTDLNEKRSSHRKTKEGRKKTAGGAAGGTPPSKKKVVDQTKTTGRAAALAGHEGVGAAKKTVRKAVKKATKKATKKAAKKVTKKAAKSTAKKVVGRSPK